MEKKLLCMFVKLIQVIIVVFFVLTQLFCVFENYPTQSKIDDVMKKYSLQKDEKAKTELLKLLLNEMRNPQNSSDEKLLKEFLSKLTTEYKMSKDEAILSSFDLIQIQGGFANYICSVYSNLSTEENFIKRYSKIENRPSIERCIGISFSKSDVESKIYQNH